MNSFSICCSTSGTSSIPDQKHKSSHPVKVTPTPIQH